LSRVDVNRREFLRITAGTCAAWAMPTSGPTAASSKMVGIQVGAVSFVDEDTEKVLDVLQERASVNTLVLAVFTYGRDIAGRRIPGQPSPDHGKQEYDLNFHGPNFATPHPECTLEGVAGTKTLIWPGIHIDIPTEPGHSNCTPQSVKEAVLAAFRAGAPVILSRKYSEMQLADLSGAGEAIREWKQTS